MRVVLLEGSHGDKGPSKTPGGMLVVAVVVLVGGLGFGLGRLTTPATEAFPETTTTATPSLETPTTRLDRATWTVERIATTEQFTWHQTGSIETWPLGLFDVAEGLLLFGTPTAPHDSGDEYGLSLWRSQDGLSWESVGQVIPPETSIHQVKQTGNRFIAAGSLEDGTPVLLTSQDGLKWTSIDGPPSDPATGIFEVVHASDDMLILSLIPSSSDRLVENALPKEWQSDDIDWEVVGSRDSPTIIIRGPLGIVAAQFTAEELGLTADDLTAYFDEDLDHPTETTLWILSEEGWSRSTIERSQISVVLTMADGKLVAAGGGPMMPAAWTSADGRSWTRVPFASEGGWGGLSRPWRDGVITSNPFGYRADLLFSTDLENWKSLGVDDLLPSEFLWNLNPIAISDAGIALVANTYIETGLGFGEPSPSVSIQSGQFTLTRTPGHGVLHLRRNGEHVVNIPIWNDTPQDSTILDFEQRTITILDPDTDEQLVSFGFDELRELWLETSAREAMDNEMKALLYSTDGVDWLVQELDAVDAQSILMLDDRLLVTTMVPWIDGFGNPLQTTIWVGLLP